MMRAKSLIVAVSILLSIAFPAAADDVITINLGRAPLFGTDPPQQSYILVTAGPSPPTICYVLSPGGGGGLAVAVNGNRLDVNATNFLVRSRHLLAGAAQVNATSDTDEDDEDAGVASQGSCVAVLDAATDFLSNSPGILRGFRRSDARMFDIAAVIADLRARFGSTTKIVLVGTSRGTLDMTEFASRVGAGQLGVPVHALVDTATLFRGTTGNPANVFDVALDQIRVPTAIIHHVQDGCIVTPVEDVDDFANALVSARRVRTRLIKGGFPPVDPNPCGATTFHGFLGTEARVIRTIVRFVNRAL